MLEINDKFSLICLNGMDISNDFPDMVDLPFGYFASTHLPAKPDSHWRESLGNFRADELENANLYLGCKMQSKTPEVLDNENEDLGQKVLCFYWAVHLTDFLITNSRPLSCTGCLVGPGLNVRSVGQMAYPQATDGTPLECARLDSTRLLRSAELASKLYLIYDSEDFRRFKRIFSSFTRGINEKITQNRLHYFVRCIEGFIIPEIGEAKSKFKSRTELFIGPKYHDVMGELYDLRSLAEHLHDVLEYYKEGSKKQKLLKLYRRTFEAEALARYCISRLVSNAELWCYFKNEDSLKDFWKLDLVNSKTLWGEQVSLNEISSRFEEGHIHYDSFA